MARADVANRRVVENLIVKYVLGVSVVYKQMYEKAIDRANECFERRHSTAVYLCQNECDKRWREKEEGRENFRDAELIPTIQPSQGSACFVSHVVVAP